MSRGHRKPAMLRKVAITLYGVGCIAALWLTVVFYSANAHLPWEWRPDYVAWSCIPMVILMLGVLYAQWKNKKVLLSLIVIVVTASISLLYSMLFHSFPEQSKLIGAAHLIIVISALVWIVFQINKIGFRKL